jgi:tetratricopeptide (TPR) repeat protein
MERSSSAITRQQDNFNRILREFDDNYKNSYFTEREIDFLNGELDKLERTVISVESWLSVLKRRRLIANIHIPSMINYRNSIERALGAYPFSAPIIAVASSALVRNSAINREAEQTLRSWLPFIADESFNTLRLSLHVLLGDFNNPQRAQVLPANLFSDGTQEISVNLAILKTLREDYTGAASDIQMLLREGGREGERGALNVLRFAAEYHYDFGSLLRSAEIFSLINDERSLVRQADALFLAGFTEIAHAIWNILSEYNCITSLYNLAVTSEEKEKSLTFLQRLVSLETEEAEASTALDFGFIRYSRFLEYPQALALLRQRNRNIYVDLEIAKRHAQEHNLGRQIAETWLLLDRHEDNEELYKWACWHLFFHRDFHETAILLDRLELLGISAVWVDVYRAIQLMAEGYIFNAQNLLRSIPAEYAPWTVYANLGRIYESLGSPARAIEQYELAIETLLAFQFDQKTAARLYIRIARCFMALARPLEARRTYQLALELDPENILVRLELDRFF